MKRVIDDARVFINGFMDVDPWTDGLPHEACFVWIQPENDTLYVIDDAGCVYWADHRDDMLFYTSDLEMVQNGDMLPAAIVNIVEGPKGPEKALYRKPGTGIDYGLFREEDPEDATPAVTFWLEEGADDEAIHDAAEFHLLESGLDTSFTWVWRELKK